MALLFYVFIMHYKSGANWLSLKKFQFRYEIFSVRMSVFQRLRFLKMRATFGHQIFYIKGFAEVVIGIAFGGDQFDIVRCGKVLNPVRAV
jgi:hypothetical protein